MNIQQIFSANEIFKLNLSLTIHFQTVDFMIWLETKINSINQFMNH